MRASTLVEAEARMTAFRLSGFRAVRITSLWTPGLTKPTDDELRSSRTSATPPSGTAFALYVTVMHPGSRTTPLTDEARADFASFAAAIVRGAPSIEHVIIGNEPNLNRFWLPQFGLDGTSAAPADYLALLARTYDALKGVSSDGHRLRRSRLPAWHRPSRRGFVPRTLRRPSSRASESPIGRAVAHDP